MRHIVRIEFTQILLKSTSKIFLLYYLPNWVQLFTYYLVYLDNVKQSAYFTYVETRSILVVASRAGDAPKRMVFLVVGSFQINQRICV